MKSEYATFGALWASLVTIVRSSEQTLQMFHEPQIDLQGRMAVHGAGNLILIKLGDVLGMPARRTAAFCSRKPTVPACRPSLAPFDDLGYPFSLIVLSVNRMKLGPGGGSRAQEMSRTAFVGDQMTLGGQKGFGMTKHGRSGHATRSPRFRFLQKLEAKKNDRKDRSRIKDPKQSVEELFHRRKPT